MKENRSAPFPQIRSQLHLQNQVGKVESFLLHLFQFLRKTTRGYLILQEGLRLRLTAGDSTGEELSSSSLIGSQIRSTPCFSINSIVGSIFQCNCDPDHRALGPDLSIVDLDLRLKLDCFDQNFFANFIGIAMRLVSSLAALATHAAVGLSALTMQFIFFLPTLIQIHKVFWKIFP